MEVFISKKNLWIIIGIIAVLIPVIVVMCLNIFVWVEEPEVIEPVKVANGGVIQPTGSQGLYEFKSRYGYKLSYNPKYKTNLKGEQFDFHITNDDNSVSVQVTPIPLDESITSITTKEEWDALMADMGPCIEFSKTSFNGMDVLVAHYGAKDDATQTSYDILIATLIGKEYAYTYCYTATDKASETEAQQIGAILYTISEY